YLPARPARKTAAAEVVRRARSMGTGLPEVAEAAGVAGHRRVQLFKDLTPENSILIHQVAAVAAEHLQRDVGLRPGRLDQAEAVRRGAEDGGEVGVVGLVLRVGGLAVLLGGEGVDQPGVEAGLAEGTLHGAVVLAG